MAFDGSKNQLAQDLIAARALIDAPEKWAKGGFVTRDGAALCIAGAIKVALGEPRDMGALKLRGFCPRGTAAHNAVTEALPEGFHYPFVFNDQHSTTHEDILSLLDRAISKALAEPS